MQPEEFEDDVPAEHDGPAAEDAPAGADPQRPSAEVLLWAYRGGIFPMVDPDRGVVEWFRPHRRGILPLSPPDAFHVPHNLAREVRQRRFEIRCDSAFERVIRSCATDRDSENRSWLDDRLIAPYLELHRRGHAHCVEAWSGERLVGGLYGVHIGGAFFGESMFNRPDLDGSNSSKVCLVHLVRWLQKRGFTLLDTQFWNPHLEQFGCIEIPVGVYEAMLAHAVAASVTWGDFEPLAP